MKFQKYLVNTCVPEWLSAYVDYKGLKRYIKQHPVPGDDIFIKKLQLELGKVSLFFDQQCDTLPFRLAFIERRLSVELVHPTTPAPRQFLSVFYHANHVKEIKYSRFLLRELHRYCTFLLNFQKLNKIAFVKILKKYDKRWNTDLRSRLVDVFVKSVVFLDVRPKRYVTIIETHLTSIFAYISIHYPQLLKRRIPVGKNNSNNGNSNSHHHHSLAMRYIRGTWRRHDEFAFFRVGLEMGIGTMLVVLTVMNLIKRDAPAVNRVMNHPASTSVLYMFGGMFIIVVSFFGFSLNLMLWNKYRINYVFIFETSVVDNLTWKQFTEFAAVSFLLWSLCVYLTIRDVLADWIPFYYVPLILVGFYVLILVCPVPILYKRARYSFVRTILRVLTPGFHHVTFRDFFVADLLISLTFFWTSLYLTACFYLRGLGSLESTTTVDVGVCSPRKSWVTPFLISLPLFIRLIQCLRKRVELRMQTDLYNAGKYLCAIAGVFLSSLATITGTVYPLILWITVGTVSAIYSFYWDVNKDWKVFTRNASIPNILPKRWLRVATVVNFFLRFNWMLTISTTIIFNRILLAFIFGILEVIRRYMWALYRVELEHTHNVEHYRAIKDIPLLTDNESELV